MKALPFHFAATKDAAPGPYRPTAIQWPAAATASVPLTLATHRAAGTPVWTRAVTAASGQYAGPATADVRVLDHAAAERAGLTGALFSVTARDAHGTGRIRVGLDYGAFAEAYGGNYGSRLRLAEVPACAATTPGVASCRRTTPLPSDNDPTTHQVSAEVTVASKAVLLAAVSDPGTDGGSAGTYAATDLKPSGSWTGGGSTGAFTYSYPVTVPPAPSGLVPQVGLSYNSNTVDGQTASTQAQASWAGDGWQTPQSFVEQSFASCKDSPEGSPSPKGTDDLCYNGPTLSLSMLGSTTTLVQDARTHDWHPESDNGAVVTHHTGGNTGTGTHDDDYWSVTTRDGTVYEFGHNTIPGLPAATHSVDTVPVYSAHSGDPCYHSSGFDDSSCRMARRWNLDYVHDVHGNAMTYYYHQDTNYYGRNRGATMDWYVRDSYLERIDYGFTGGSISGTAGNRIVLGTAGRCEPTSCPALSNSTKTSYPDVPYDLICNSGATCPADGPSYFSTVRLASITTQQWSTDLRDYAAVDTYVLGHRLPATGDGSSPALWLTGITHTGYLLKQGLLSSITLPTVTFTGIQLQNRVASTDGIQVFYRRRIETITTETGSRITVSYQLPKACGSLAGKDAAGNTSSCFPVQWTPAGYTAPITDWFNKYAVERVTQSDPTGGSAGTATTYMYGTAGAAWHYDDNEQIKPKHRTYGEFRGYGTVTTLTGDGVNDRRTQASTAYYRGMSRNHSATAVVLTDSAGGKHDDTDALAGQTLETTINRGEGGPVDSSTITSYWVSGATASRPRYQLDDLTANWVAPALTYTRQAVTGDGSAGWRYTETDNTYDDDVSSATLGLLTASYTHTVPAVAAYDRCTTNQFAKVNTTLNLVGLISQTETVSTACAGFQAGSPATVPAAANSLSAPMSVSRPAQVVSQVRTFYDDEAWSESFPQPAAPMAGDVTMTRTAKDWGGGAYVYQTSARSTYDTMGRVKDAYDANGGQTQTVYTADPAGLTTAVSVINPLNQKVSSTTEPRRGLTLTTSDANNVVTTQDYDALGRVIQVWRNSRAITDTPNYVFSYTVSQTGITATTAGWSNDSNDPNGHITTTTLYDAMLRPRQTQSDTQQSGRLITDTFYDTHGWIYASNDGWWDSAHRPNTSLVGTDGLATKVPHQTYTTYDGLGHAVIKDEARFNVNVERTITAYNGDRTTVVPPSGGTVTTSVADPLGRPSGLQQYTTTPVVTLPANIFTGIVTVTGGTSLNSQYGYDGHGREGTVTDPAGNAWTTHFDLLGRAVDKVDPDAGSTTGMTYDGNGNLLQSTDARGRTVSTTYDRLNRKTGTYAAATADQSTGNRIASWVYDNANNAVLNMKYAIGKLTTATAYSGTNAYTTQAAGFNVFGSSIGETVSIPAAENELSGDYKFSHLYTTHNGLPAKDTYPAKGTLPAETVFHQHDAFDQPDSIYGLGGYASGVTQDAYGRIIYATLAGGSQQANITTGWDEHTGRLLNQTVTRLPTAPRTVDQEAYRYDQVGNLLQETSTRLGAASPSETQCFAYDALLRLTSAWTATDACATAPTSSNQSMVGNSVGGGSAYWSSWTIDDLGNRTQQVQHGLAGGSDATTTYIYDGNGAHQPHTLTATNTTGAAPTATAYRYDAAGNMTSRTTGAGTQTLDWDDSGRLASVTGPQGDSSNVYGPDGNLLIQRDPGSTTLYLPNGQQHTLNTSTKAVTGVRYYPLPGGGTAIRTGSGSAYTYALLDPHGTPSLYLDNTVQTPTWRQYTPYGDPRGPSSAYPDNRGFLNAPTNGATGLVHVGAREYDASAGRFISVDPVQDTADPQQWNGYAYASNNPTTRSDPTGLRVDGDRPGCSLGNGGSCGGYSMPDPDPGCAHAAANACEHRDDEADGILRQPVKVSKTTAQGLITRGYGGSNKFLVQELLTFASQSTDNWVYLCTQLGMGDSQDCDQNNPTAPDRPAWQELVGGAIIVAGFAVGPVCAAFIAVCGGLLLDAAEGELAFASSGSYLGASGGTIGAGKLLGKLCSFTPDTPVLMSDGSAKPIKDIRVGDTVLATEPSSDETAGETVTALHDNLDHDFADLTVRVAGRSDGVVHMTQNHRLWDETTHEWVEARAFPLNDRVLTANGRVARVVGVHLSTGSAHMLNLTVARIHTYYVLAGDTPVLVHNTCGRIEVGVGAVGNLANFTPAEAEAEFVFDASSRRLLTGDVSGEGLSGSPHQQLARSLGADEETVLGGTIFRDNGRLVFTENSGHYGHRWTDATRQQFQTFLSDQGIDFEYRPWG